MEGRLLERCDLVGCHLVGQQLVRGDLVRGDLVRRNVVRGDVVGCDLVRCNVVGCHVVRRNVVGCYVVRGDLVGSYVVRLGMARVHVDVIRTDVQRAIGGRGVCGRAATPPHRVGVNRAAGMASLAKPEVSGDRRTGRGERRNCGSGTIR